MTRIPLSGIKIGGPLLAILIDGGGSHGAAFYSRLCRLLAAEEINITFAAMRTAGDSSTGLCCIAQEDHQQVQTILDREAELRTAVHFRSWMGLVGLFPHQHRFQVLGQALDGFGRENIKIHGMASSVSALSFIIDYHQMPRAVTALSHCFQLPPGHNNKPLPGRIG